MATISAYLTPPKLPKILCALNSFPTYLALTHDRVHSRFEFKVWHSNLTHMATNQNWTLKSFLLITKILKGATKDADF